MRSTPMLPVALLGFIDALKKMPGIGQRSAQRIAFSLLLKQSSELEMMASAIQSASELIVKCQQCRAFADQDLCPICLDEARDDTALCVVENIEDMLALERSGVYKGRYFVLHGKISPIDGIGPSDLGLDLLKLRIQSVQEVILAISQSMETEATMHFLQKILKTQSDISISNIALGVPFGSKFDYLDARTLSYAFSKRELLDDY